MTTAESSFIINGLQKIKDYFQGKPEVQDDIQYIKVLFITLEKQNKTLRKEMIKLIQENKRLKNG